MWLLISVSDGVFMFFDFIFKKNIRFAFTFCFGLSSLMAVPGSQGVESFQYPQVWEAVNQQSSQEDIVGISDVQLFFKAQFKVAKEFMKSKIWMLKNLSMESNYDTPNVVMELPLSTPVISKAKNTQHGEMSKFSF